MTKIEFVKSKCCMDCKHFEDRRTKEPGDFMADSVYYCNKHKINLGEAMREKMREKKGLVLDVKFFHCKDWEDNDPEESYLDIIFERIDLLNNGNKKRICPYYQGSNEIWIFDQIILHVGKQTEVQTFINSIIKEGLEKYKDALGHYYFSFAQKYNEFKEDYHYIDGKNKNIWFIFFDLENGERIIPYLRTFLKRGKETGIGIFFFLKREGKYIDPFIRKNCRLEVDLN